METVLNGFDEFWEIYPRKVAKQAAIRMYKRALKLTTPATILSAATRYARERSGKDIEFTKHPATWLNGERWQDYTSVPSVLPAPKAPAGVYVKFTDSEALEAWDAYRRKTEG